MKNTKRLAILALCNNAGFHGHDTLRLLRRECYNRRSIGAEYAL